MIRDAFNHGFAEVDWQDAKDKARGILVDRAQREKLISYSELVSEITSISLQPHDPRLAHFLGEIAAEEEKAGRGMLTVLVVHKSGDQKPGKGFFQMARSLGRLFDDDEIFWIEEFKRVCGAWRLNLR